jgi:mono/diheme cytochrome c family protein
MKRFVIGLAVLAAPLLIAPASAQEELRLGAEVYSYKCASCHGDLGPDGPDAGGEVVPPFFVGPRYLYAVSPRDIRAAVLYGVPGTGMIGMGGELSDEEIEALIEYIEYYR